MSANRLCLSPLLVLCLALIGIPEADASKKEANSKTEAMTLKLSDLTADTAKKDVKRLERTVKKVKGVVRVAVLKKKGDLIVRYTKAATAEAIKTAVGKAGFTVVEPKPDGDPEEDGGADVPQDDDYE